MTYAVAKTNEPVVHQSEVVPTIAQPSNAQRNNPKRRKMIKSFFRLAHKQRCPKVRKRVPTNGLVIGDNESGYQEPNSQLSLDTEAAPQHGQKRSHSEAFPESPKHTAISQRPPRRNKARWPLVQSDDRAADNNDNESLTESLSGVQALLQRWFDASATDVLLRSSDN